MQRLFIAAVVSLIIGVSYGQSDIVGNFYNLSNHPKSKGLNYKIKVPQGWIQSEGDRPNIVQKWTPKTIFTPSDYIEIQVMVKYQPDNFKDISKEEWEYILKYENGMKDWLQYVADVPHPTEIKYFSIDNYPGVYHKTKIDASRLDKEYTVYMTTVYILMEKHVLSLNLFCVNKNIQEKYEFLFRSMCNNIVLLDQYK